MRVHFLALALLVNHNVPLDVIIMCVCMLQLERTIAQQQREIRETQDKLASHDASAKRAIATLQGEIKHRMEQVVHSYSARYCENTTIFTALFHNKYICTYL